MLRTVLVGLAGLLLATPAFAGATPWQDVAPGARLRLISSDQRAADGTTTVGLELDMPDSFKTYWKLPGESGIPTEMDITGSSGVSAPQIEWPFPSSEITQGLLDHVYRGNVVLPVKLKAAPGPALLKAAVTMGVCSEVCVPVRASFELPLSFDQADMGQSLRLAQAASQAPIPWDGGDAAFGPLRYDARSHALTVALADPGVDPGSVLAVASDPGIVFGMPQKSPDGHSILLPLRGPDPGPGWTAAPVTLTFMTARGAYEVSERVTPVP